MQNSVVIFLRSLLSYVLFTVIGVIIGVPLLVILVITPHAYMQKNSIIYWLLALLFRLLLYASLIPFKIIKATSVYPYPALYVANHQSAGDVLVLGYLQGTLPHFWFYWDHFSQTPILSPFITRLGLGITQTDVRHDARILVEGISLVRDLHCNAIIFPEGGRFNDGIIHPFACGFALLARKAAVPVIPVYIHNMGKAYPPGSFAIYRYPITVQVGAPMWVSAHESDQDFCTRVQQWFDKCNVT